MDRLTKRSGSSDLLLIELQYFIIKNNIKLFVKLITSLQMFSICMVYYTQQSAWACLALLELLLLQTPF